MESGRVEVGKKYFRLTVLELIPHRKNPQAKCKCDCGNIVISQRGGLKSGHTKSCGCYKNEVTSKRVTKHGMSGTKIYRAWVGMMQRCNNQRLSCFDNYGGRGIKVCRRWANSFDAFLNDMGIPTSERMTLERKNTNGDYMPSNCCWATHKEQAENKRVSRRWIVNGKEYTSSVAVAKVLNVHPSSIVRSCNGYTKHGKYHPPRNGFSSKPLYFV